ncbi:hypothetical protein KBC75_00055 [Candidatus Shapirobacteria bacterium]|nr:hypothetical protein [Candidatus Shapirobacteria bacterium]
MSDLKYISSWWLTIFLLSTLAWPILFTFFHKFWDRGYIFTKIASILTLTYIIFVLGVFKFVPYTSGSLFVLIVFIIFLNYLFLRQKNNLANFVDVLKSKWSIFLFEEILFLAVLLIWSYVRSFSPDIESLEKFMDWGFVNSALRSTYMPPIDMWFASEPINYYYFGHLMVATLTKLSNIDSSLTYNLAMASTCALTFVSGFSLASNLVAVSLKKFSIKPIILAGLISGLLLTFGGNLHTVYKIGSTLVKNEGRLVLSKDAITRAASTYWYPDATRFIGFDPDVKDKTIHEFPLYSFVVADLHGHMNDIPVVIFFMAFLLSTYISVANFPNWFLVVPAGFLLSIAYMTNAWDFAVYGLVFAIFSFIHTSYFLNLKSSLVQTFSHGIFVIFFWYLFSLPFSLNFIPMADGLNLSDMHTPFYQLFILYGGFWLICLPFVLGIIATSLRGALRRSNLSSSDLFVLSLIVTATILIIIPEIGYVKDIYIYEHRRANTMFKLVYEAFIMYSLSSGYVLIRLSNTLKPVVLNVFYKLVFLLVFVSHLIYPYFAIRGFTDHHPERKSWGLYGLDFLKDSNPDNLLAIEWINKNIVGQPVILEAVGDSYTTFGQVSVATGLPTVEGWIVHEWLWRGGYDKPAARQSDVQQIYEAKDPEVARTLLQKYNVKYVFVGDKEFEKYPEINVANFDKLGKVVFTSGKTKIYQLF